MEKGSLHFAITPDGNRRWAKQRGLPIEAGHFEGSNRIEPIVEQAAKDGVDAVTIFAFAKKNINRPPDEWIKLNGVFRHMLNSPVVDRMFKNNVRVNVIGEVDIFDTDIQERVEEIKEQTTQNSGMVVSFALNYDGRSEIVRANMLAWEKRPAERRDPITDPLSEEEISANMYTAGLPDLAMMIRTGGMKRLSSFLTWQSVDTELYFTDTLWPDFTVDEYNRASEWFHNQQRNFGK